MIDLTVFLVGLAVGAAFTVWLFAGLCLLLVVVGASCALDGSMTAGTALAMFGGKLLVLTGGYVVATLLRALWRSFKAGRDQPASASSRDRHGFARRLSRARRP